MQIMQHMLDAGRFREFIHEVLGLYVEEENEKTAWEVWLHRIFDKSYTEFKKSLGMIKQTKAAPTKDEAAKIVQQSFDMLNSFKPVEGCCKDGIIQITGNDSD